MAPPRRRLAPRPRSTERRRQAPGHRPSLPPPSEVVGRGRRPRPGPGRLTPRPNLAARARTVADELPVELPTAPSETLDPAVAGAIGRRVAAFVDGLTADAADP